MMGRFSNLLILFVFSTAVLSCESLSRPYIGREKMISILYDMNLAESWSTFSNGNNMTQAKNTDSLAVYDISILKHYEVTLSDFQQSMEWYKMHTDEMDSIYVRLAQKCSKEQSIDNNRRK